eukprot:9481731-Pyramimonas_sp.AAC.1
MDHSRALVPFEVDPITQNYDSGESIRSQQEFNGRPLDPNDLRWKLVKAAHEVSPPMYHAVPADPARYLPPHLINRDPVRCEAVD